MGGNKVFHHVYIKTQMLLFLTEGMNTGTPRDITLQECCRRIVKLIMNTDKYNDIKTHKLKQNTHMCKMLKRWKSYSKMLREHERFRNKVVTWAKSSSLAG